MSEYNFKEYMCCACVKYVKYFFIKRIQNIQAAVI